MLSNGNSWIFACKLIKFSTSIYSFIALHQFVSVFLCLLNNTFKKILNKSKIKETMYNLASQQKSDIEYAPKL